METDFIRVVNWDNLNTRVLLVASEMSAKQVKEICIWALKISYTNRGLFQICESAVTIFNLDWFPKNV